MIWMAIGGFEQEEPRTRLLPGVIAPDVGKRDDGNPPRTQRGGQAREAAEREDEGREASGRNAAKRRREGRLTDHLHDHQRVRRTTRRCCSDDDDDDDKQFRLGSS